MEEFQSYSPEEIILSNLGELFERSMQLSEQLLAHLRELAGEIADGFRDPASFLESLPEHRLPPREEALRSLPQALRSFGQARSTLERALLCIELRKKLPVSSEGWQEIFFPVGENSPDGASKNRISYQRNHYTDEAFGRFWEALGGARVSYVSDFSAVCESVYNGSTEYGILPIESSEEGRLGNFARLIDRYDLKITATCDVRVGDGRITRFALLRRTPTVLPTPSPRPRYFEGRCEMKEHLDVQDLLEAARICGLKTERADLKRSEDGGKQTLHVTLSADKGDLPAFLLYLAMEVPSFHTVGYYANYTT